MNGIYFYLSADMGHGATVNDRRLDMLTDRHRLSLRLPELHPTSGDLKDEIESAGAAGIIFGITRGLPLKRQIKLAARLHASGYRVFFYFVREHAIEVVDFERISSLQRHWLLIEAYCRRVGHTSWLALMKSPQLPEAAIEADEIDNVDGEGLLGSYRRDVRALIARAAPAQLPSSLQVVPRPGSGAAGNGMYLRTDFWAPIIAGGSYGHTCYVAKELARLSNDFVCVMANRFPMLDEMGLKQIVPPLEAREGNELNILAANDAYYPHLRAIVEEHQPSYIYERICLGNYLGARISQEFGIPYIVEYNGSEISMMRSFAGSGYTHEDLFLLAEEAAFAQATLISVISEPVRDDLLRRGIDPAKILVNPNGVDPEAYRQADADERTALKARFGWTADNPVVGFTGTFGGWHGIDVLAEALPKISAAAPQVRFLLIGDGNNKQMIDAAITSHNLQGQVVCTGRVPQSQGAELLRACDIYVSPHSSHMVDSRFFGSPTKIFEYMAMGPVVASDLEQIGIVLSPGMQPGELAGGKAVTTERSVLCEPGDVDSFVTGVLDLVRHPNASNAMAKNARQAILYFYSWERHVERLWDVLVGGEVSASFQKEFVLKRPATRILITNDAYKDETQRQWNQDACGSHYVKNAELHTKEWYLEAEAYRYGEYAPWMPETMEFARHRGKHVLEIGGGMGTDLAQWAQGGAYVTDLDLSSGHLSHAEENFRLRGLSGRFVHGDAETIPFDEASFDIVYSNGVIHHSPHTERIVSEIFRVLRPGGKAIIMVYAENSLHYWRNLVRDIGVAAGALELWSMGEIMSRHVELGTAKPLVKVYTKHRLRELFAPRFENISIVQQQMTPAEIPRRLQGRVTAATLGRLAGWNLILKADKPRR
jgi:glycosyltransferase involved in cell wall biosynthesis/ubiquinone/menaquinone biosynthesis C-methylase UbiE